MSEIELALNNFSGKSIGITGTNGKSTVASMCYHILKKYSQKCQLAGNIGFSACEAVLNEPNCEYLVLELSSYQLAQSQTLDLDKSCITNLSEDHLDYHETLQSYYQSKLKILKSDKPSFNGFISSEILSTCKMMSLLNQKHKYQTTENLDLQAKESLQKIFKNKLEAKNAYLAFLLTHSILKKEKKINCSILKKLYST